ncbi:unnamed protein product [Rotaria sp. Silwood2]|nr:unnamed protein product [Rotaria sp. Silwood2]CAF4305285.1 unnamed protein product [Rotaria sp. Silwood2]
MYNKRLDQPQPLQWCQGEGNHIIYENEWIQIIITVTKLPNWNEKYKMIFKDRTKILCTIDNTQNTCDHREIQVKTWSFLTQIIHPIASLRIIIVRYGNDLYHDIILYQQNSTIIRQSKGLCVHESIHCEIDHSTIDDIQHRNQLNLIDQTYEQFFVNKHAEEICIQYHEFVRQMMREFDLPLISQTTKDVSITSCINDLKSTGNIQFAKSILQLSFFDSLNNFDINENKINKYLEKIDYALEKTLQIIDDRVMESVTIDDSQSYIALKNRISQKAIIKLVDTPISPSKITTNISTFAGSRISTSDNIKAKDICHVYGDPHIIRFPQQSNGSQDQYWCKISGEHRILKNDYVEIKAIVQDRTWFIVKFSVTFFKDNGTVLCTVTDDEQYCNSSEIKITRPSPSQINILYMTPQLQISIVPHQYQVEWYDISVRMSYDLIRQSNGLCIMSSNENCEIENSIQDEEENNIQSLSKSICEQYITESIRASNELGLSNDADRYKNALIACIHDYETTGNKNVGASIVDMIIKQGINRKQLDDLQFDLLTIASISIINNAIANASAQIDILLSSTIMTSSIITITQTTSSSSLRPTTSSSSLRPTTSSSSVRPTTSSSSLRPTTSSSSLCPTTSGCSITVKSTNIMLIFFSFLSFIELLYLFI